MTSSKFKIFFYKNYLFFILAYMYNEKFYSLRVHVFIYCSTVKTRILKSMFFFFGVFNYKSLRDLSQLLYAIFTPLPHLHDF